MRREQAKLCKEWNRKHQTTVNPKATRNSKKRINNKGKEDKTETNRKNAKEYPWRNVETKRNIPKTMESFPCYYNLKK
jgi:hypothetical protein